LPPRLRAVGDPGGTSVKVLVVGQGGREHALAWKLAQSPKVSRVYVAPGNGGTAVDCTNVPIRADDVREIVRFCVKESIDLAVVGPEGPLVAGLVDELQKASITVFGPTRDAALLEGSKIFCKKLLKKAKVPTADFRTFKSFEQVKEHLEAHPFGCVVKADGLAAGKGAIVCDDPASARRAAKRILVDREFGDAGNEILIEELLEGQEVSLLALTDGRTITTLELCQDHKRAHDGDQGPNTGGMGAYCPAPLLSADEIAAVERDVLIPTIHEMRAQRRPFQGVLYAGLMITPAGPKVLEYNVRFGDPECQPLLMRLKTDLFDLLHATAKGRLADVAVEWDPRPAVCVVIASGGYPGAYKTGLPIRGLEDAARLPDVKVFHSGTTLDDDGRTLTAGGRVLTVTALGDDLVAAKARAYEAVAKISFTGAFHRTDVADKAIARLS
jgi:phosphoribosylamine--glycine ligase